MKIVNNSIVKTVQTGIQTGIQTVAQRRPQAAIALLILILSVWIYLSNGDLYLASNDNVPSTLLAFNWLENGTLTFDNFRDSYFFRASPPYYFTEAPNGHLVSTYPIGSAIVTFPLYLLFFLYLKLASLLSGENLLAITQPQFEPYRREFGKLAATLCSALAAVLFYLAVRLKFQQATALLVTFLFAFATAMWALCAQDVRQHTVSNLLIVAIVLCLWKANQLLPQSAGLSADSSANLSADSPEDAAIDRQNVLRQNTFRQNILLLTAGFFCGLLPGVRLTSAIFTAATLLFVLYAYRRRSLFFLLGLPSLLFNLIWNIYHFGWGGFLGGGYGQMFDAGASSYRIEPLFFAQAFVGQLFSPSDGLFIFSPVLLFALPGFWIVWQRRSQRDEQLLLCLTFACIGLFLHYCIYAPWNGGSDSYGARFLSDVVPVLSLLTAYPIDRLLQRFTDRNSDRRSPTAPAMLGVFLSLLLLSAGIQAVGTFTKIDWGAIPLPLISAPHRVWQIRDSQIERHTRNLIAQIFPPIRDRDSYLQGFAGKLDAAEWTTREGKQDQPIPPEFATDQGRRRFIRIRLTNTGQSPWYGYQTGMVGLGEARIRLQFFTQDNQIVRQPEPNFFAVPGTVAPGETVESIGRVNFPRRAGVLEGRFLLVATGLENPITEGSPLYAFQVTIEPGDEPE